MEVREQFHTLLWIAAFAVLVLLVVARAIISFLCCRKKVKEPLAVQIVNAHREKLD